MAEGADWKNNKDYQQIAEGKAEQHNTGRVGIALRVPSIEPV